MMSVAKATTAHTGHEPLSDCRVAVIRAIKRMKELGPHPASTREFWKTINKTRTQKKSGEIPTLKVDDKVYKTDEEKANLFGSILSETFAHDGSSTEFDIIVHDQVKQFVEELDYSDSNYPI